MDTLQLCIVAALLATNVSVIRLGIRLYKLEQVAKVDRVVVREHK